MFKDANVLVTGGAGFIGTNLINKLVKLGANITATFRSRKPQVRDDRVKWYRGDLTSKFFCSEILQDIDYVFMCAANTSGASVMENSPLTHVTPNVLMNTIMMDAAYKAGVKKFLFLSTTTVYPLLDRPIKEEDILSAPLFEKYFCVGWMKIFAEKLCEMYATKINNPMTTIVVRPGNLYGKYDDFEWETSHVIPALIRRVVERHDPIEVWGDGKDVKDFTYVEDFIDGLILAMRKIDAFDIVHIGSGKSCTVRDVLDIVLKLDRCFPAKITFDSSKPTMIPYRVLDISKARKLLGFEPKTSMEEGLAKTIEWYKEEIPVVSNNSMV